MKKYFGVALAFVVMLGSAVVLHAQKANPASDFEYYLNGEGTGLVIKKYKGEAKDVIIPSVIEDFPVVELGSSAFSFTSVVSVVIPNSVQKIEVLAFCGCTSLTSVTIPNSVQKIGWDAFSGCSSLSLKEQKKIRGTGYKGGF